MPRDLDEMKRILQAGQDQLDRMTADRDKRRAEIEQSGELAEFTGLVFLAPDSVQPATDDASGEPLAAVRTLAELVAKAQALLAEHGDMPLTVSATIDAFDRTEYKTAHVIYEPYVYRGIDGRVCAVMITL